MVEQHIDVAGVPVSLQNAIIVVTTIVIVVGAYSWGTDEYPCKKDRNNGCDRSYCFDNLF